LISRPVTDTDQKVFVALDQQAGHRHTSRRRGGVSGKLRLDPPRRLEQTFQQVGAGSQLSDRRQIGPDRRAAIADAVTTAALNRLRPEQLLTAATIAVESQDSPGTRARPQLSFAPAVVRSQISFVQVADWSTGELRR
jgi:hypothetical protein